MATKQQKPSRLSDIAATHHVLDFPYLSAKSLAWLRAKMSQLKNPVRIANTIAAERDRYKKSPRTGYLYFMMYDPITKDKMKYYDTFPLIIMLELDSTHFTGLNLHYLPPRLRAVLLEALVGNQSHTTEENDPARFTNAKKILEFAKNHPIFKHCIKRYLISQMQSKFLKVEPYEWETALFLPVQQFQKASSNQVWQDSMKRDTKKGSK